jgi:phenylpropionate dioxygenase-like ring-hydroxylating dioxygenase large terminal subunit
MIENWVPVALSPSIEPATSAGAVVDGLELVVWRDNKGVAHVWEDRCPHRGMRMSFGFVRGDHIACLYHGWEYDAAGRCRYIPAHPELDVPQTIKVATYAAAERAGLIWTRLAENADPADIPLSGEAEPVRSIYVDCSMATAATFLDQMSEPAGAHCWRLSAADVRLFVAGQSIAVGRIALHILILGAASAEAKKSVARWAEGLRLSLEDPARAVQAMAEFA